MELSLHKPPLTDRLQDLHILVALDYTREPDQLVPEIPDQPMRVPEGRLSASDPVVQE